MKTPPRVSTEAAGIFLIRLAVLALLLMGLAKTWADPDLWGHVRFGGDILRDGLTVVDPYSFTSDVPWVNHEWLAEIIMYGAWATGGSAGLIALKMAIILGTLGLIALTLRLDRLPATTRDVAVAVALLGLWARVFVVRPQLFSIILFAALLWILRSAERGRPERLWGLPFLFAFWVNAHGGWIVGVGALLVWSAIGMTPLGPGLLRTRLALAAGLALVATLANPYGTGLWTFLWETVRLNRPNISDWRPLAEAGPQVILPWALSAVLALAALVQGRRRIPVAHALIAIGLGAASVRVNRLDVFFTLSVVLLLAPYLAKIRQGKRARNYADTSGTARPNWTRAMQIAALAVAIGLGLAGWRQRESLTCVRLDGPWMPEREAGAFIAANRLTGRLLTWFDWGQYAIWHFGPGLKVSLDGRRETVYSDAFVTRHLQLYYEPEKATKLLDDLRADYAWLPLSMPLTATLNRSGWHRLYTGPISVVFSRADSPIPLQAGTLGSACFPGP